MRRIGTRSLKNVVVAVGSKLLILAVTGLFCLWMISGARAANVTPKLQDIKSHVQGNKATIELILSSEISKENINVDFERNFVQFSIKGINAFPIKNAKINTASLDKAFSYQYQPDLARARIIFKGSASKFKSNSSWYLEKNKIVFEFTGIAKTVGDAVKTTQAANEKNSVAPTPSFPSDKLDREEDKIVKEILSGKATEAKTVAAPVAATVTQANVQDEPIFKGTKKDPAQLAKDEKANPVKKMISGLMIVISLMGGIAFAFKKLVLKRTGFGMGKSGKVIDVVSSHMLGAKKSIALIKVAGQYMVVGIAGDNINLIANLGSEVNVDKYLDENHFGGSFETFLNKKTQQAPAIEENFAPLATAMHEKHQVAKVANNAASSIRGMIKKRMESLKPLREPNV